MDTSVPSKIKIASSEIHCPTTISQNQLAMDASIQDVAAGDSFPLKLWKLLSFAEQTGKTDVISWLEDGTKFKVHDKNRFASEIMPHYFASSTYKSFQRSKNLWGFQTVSKGVHKGECSHPLFRRGDINLCRKMVRRAKSDEGADMEASEQTSTGTTNNATSNVGSAPASNLGQQPGGNVMHQSLLDNFSGLNPSLFLAQQQQMQQQQQLSSLNPFLGAAGLGGQTSNMMPNPTNPLLSVLASLGNNNGNPNILSALQQKMQAPTPAPVHSMSALQQLLQLNPQPPPQQTPASSLNQQIMALLALQQKQQQPTGSGVPDIAILSAAASVAAKGPPVASVAAPGPSATPPVSAIDTSAKKTKGRRKGKESASKAADSGGNFKEKNGDLTSKTNSLREAALARGSKVVACRARGMAMEHNMHTAFFEIPKDPEHGMDLVCSYPACRNGGIKFLYCKFCDDVIAKRTFRAQHLHEDLVKAEAAGKMKGNAAAADILDDSTKRVGKGGDVPPKKRHKKNASNDETNGSEQNGNASGEDVHEIANESTESSSSSETGEDDATDGEKVTENMVELRSQWDSLLDERQEMDSKDGISAWLDRVVETSERFKKASRRSKKKTDRS